MATLTLKLCEDADLRYRLGEKAYETIASEWNPIHAGNALTSLCEELMQGDFTFRMSGPLSEAKVVKQRKMYRHMCK